MASAADELKAFDAQEVKAWEPQPYDTEAAFDRFRRFYLPQKPPRSINRAYREWKKSEGDMVAGNATAPRRWRYWAVGQTDEGKKTDGAMTWRERLAEYDRYMALVVQAAKDQWAVDVAEADFADGQALRGFARLVLEQGPNFLKVNRKVIKGKRRTIEGKDGKQYEIQDEPDQVVTTMALDWSAAVKSLLAGSKLQRLAAGVPEPVQRHALTDKDGETLPAMDDVIESLRQARRAMDG